MPEVTSPPIQLTGQENKKYLINIAHDRGEAHSVDLAPCLISLNLGSSVFNADCGGNSDTAKMCDAVLDGGAQHPDSVWFFRGEDCYLFNVKTGKVEKGPVRLTEQWGGPSFPLIFASGIEAALWGGPIFPNIVYFFKGTLYIRFSVAQQKVDVGPTPITQDWTTARGNWMTDGPGAAVHAIETKHAGMVHLFKGSEYLRHNLNNGLSDSMPKPILIQEQWNFPEPFSKGVDFAFYGVGTESQILFFFRGDQCFGYDTKNSKVSLAPRPIFSRFPGLAQFVCKPQLFLVESYRMTTYYGDLTPGKLTDGPDIGPGSEDTFTVRIKRTTETDITKTSTVLESQDQRVVNDLNETIKESSSDTASEEKYDYHLESSFEGELSVGLGSTDANASLSVNGGTNDVRKEFSKAAEKGVTKQVQNTSENRKQTVDTVGSSYKEVNEFESVWTRRIANPTSRTISLAYAQLAQEYITLVILRGVKLAFGNGQTSEIVELSHMDKLFDKYLLTPSDREKAKTWVFKELQEVLDHQGSPRCILKEISPKRYQFDPALTSKFTFLRPDGSQKEISTEGVIMSQARFNQLTDLMVLTEVNGS